MRALRLQRIVNHIVLYPKLIVLGKPKKSSDSWFISECESFSAALFSEGSQFEGVSSSPRIFQLYLGEFS